MTPTADREAAFLALIRERPDDDGPRLVYADWLDERGDCDRAEFIRVQCELAKWKGKDKEHCPECGRHWRWRVGAGWDEWSDCEAGHRWASIKHTTLSHRERELWSDIVNVAADGDGLVFGLPVHQVRVLHQPDSTPSRTGEPIYDVRRGFVESVTLPLAAWTGGPCGRCRSQGWIYAGYDDDREECPACRGEGKTLGVGPAVVRRCPVTRVTLTDKQPEEAMWHRIDVATGEDVAVRPLFRWRRQEQESADPATLPSCIGDPRMWPPGRPWIEFSTRQDALDAASAWLLSWAKSQPQPEGRP